MERLGRRKPGFVESEPEFFARMADLVSRTEVLLERAGAFEPDTAWLVGKLRTSARLLEKKGTDKKGRDALKNVTDEEMAVLAGTGPLFMYVAMKHRVRMDKSTPESFGKLIKGMRQLADQIETGGIPNDKLLQEMLKEARLDVQPLWRRLHDVCLKLEALAHKQLRGAKFTDADNAFILRYGERIAGIMLYGGNSYLTPNDDAPRVIDVYYNPLVKRALEVGIGRARALYVLYPVKGGEVLCRGAVMPYYEFQSAKRLTDIEWRRLLDSEQRPGIPAWVKPVVAGGELRRPVVEKD